MPFSIVFRKKDRRNRSVRLSGKDYHTLVDIKIGKKFFYVFFGVHLVCHRQQFEAYWICNNRFLPFILSFLVRYLSEFWVSAAFCGSIKGEPNRVALHSSISGQGERLLFHKIIMGRGKHCTPEERKHIQGLYRENVPIKTICKAFGRSRTFVDNAIRSEATGKSTGRPRKTTADVDAQIVELIRADAFKTCAAAPRRSAHSVCRRTFSCIHLLVEQNNFFGWVQNQSGWFRRH